MITGFGSLDMLGSVCLALTLQAIGLTGSNLALPAIENLAPVFQQAESRLAKLIGPPSDQLP